EGIQSSAAAGRPRAVAREPRGPLVGHPVQHGSGVRPVAEPGCATPRGGGARRGRARGARARGPRCGHPAQPPRAGLECGRGEDWSVARRGAHALGPCDATSRRTAEGEVVMTNRGSLADILDEYLKTLEAGSPPDREALLAKHPDLAEEL